MTLQIGQRMTLSECESMAKRLLTKAGADLFMELESLAVCQKTERVFLVLKRKGVTDGTDRETAARSTDIP
jgi:hypothetical protein